MYDYGQFLDMTTYNLGKNYVIGSQYNSCPGASNVYFTVEVAQDRSGGSGEAGLTLSPNPATDFVEVTVTFDPNDKEPSDYTLEMVDGNSAVIRSMTLSGTDNRVNVQDLRPGYYIVRVLYGKTILTKTLIIG